MQQIAVVSVLLLTSMAPVLAQSIIGDWMTCTPSLDTCASGANGFTCCVAPADVGSGKFTCRPFSACQVFEAKPATVPNWNTCRPSLDTCSGGYTCCVGPLDQSIWKYTCRPGNNCLALPFSYSCQNDNSCGYRAQFDKPPNVRGTGIVNECLTLANYARALYNPTAPALVWSDFLQSHAQYSSKYSADNGCWDCHTDSGSGTSWGQNLFYQIQSCTDAYWGWVTNEAAGMGGHFQNVVGFAFQNVNMGCGVSTDGNGATVCNYGLPGTN
ncbi:hypothetical protein HDU98_009756 [Podochytrium sp. JEL0797]|nr:hypothetical protein HDU98_009756 [Podochytrium sp. JEL0797]